MLRKRRLDEIPLGFSKKQDIRAKHPTTVQSCLAPRRDGIAEPVGTDSETEASGLSDIIPRVLDQAVSGDKLLSSLGYAEGLLATAKSFLREGAIQLAGGSETEQFWHSGQLWWPSAVAESRTHNFLYPR